jgi:hypothetical protein
MNPADRVNNRLPRDNAPSRKIARRLINSRQPEGKGVEGRAHAAATACDDLYRDLSRWVGRDGCHALFVRALAQTRVEYATLDQIKLRPRSEPYLDGVAETIMARGDAATAEALESMLVHLVELLGRLIGDDMATNLIERSLTAPERGDTGPDDRREEA